MNLNHLIDTRGKASTENVGSWNLATVIWTPGCKGGEVNNAEKSCSRSYHYLVTNITMLRVIYHFNPPSNSVWVLKLLSLF